MTVYFTVNGEPQGKARPRFARGRTYTPKNTVEYEKRIREAFIETKADSFGCQPVCLTLLCFYGIPKSTSKKARLLMLLEKMFPTKKPDIDNVVKVFMDALNGVAYDDDKQVVYTSIRKVYGEEPRVEAAVFDVNDPTAESWTFHGCDRKTQGRCDMTKCFACHDNKCRILTVDKCVGFDKCHFYRPEGYDKEKAVSYVPCPFCGSDNISIRRTGELFYSELFHGVCGDCGATSPVRDTRRKAFYAWNERK